MRDGIRSSWILLILPEEHMEPTMLRHCELRFMQIAGWEGFISLTAFTQKRNSHQNSNCISQCRYHSQLPAQITIKLDSTCFSFAVNNHKSLLLQKAWWGSWHSKLRDLCCPCFQNTVSSKFGMCFFTKGWHLILLRWTPSFLLASHLFKILPF